MSLTVTGYNAHCRQGFSERLQDITYSLDRALVSLTVITYTVDRTLVKAYKI